MQKLIENYKRIPIQGRASFWFLICAFFQKGISFITTPIFTRLLSTAEYGQYNVFNSWLGIITVIVTLNLYLGVYSSGLVKFEEKRNEFSSSLQGLTLTLVSFWTIIYLIFHNFWNKLFSLSTIQMLLMLMLMWTTAVFAFWSVEQRTDFKYKNLIIVTIAVSIAKPLVGIILISFAEDKVTARIFGLVLVESVCYIWFFFDQMKRGRQFYSKEFWKYALAFNIPLIPHYLSMSVLNGADRIMIGRMVNDSAAGIYSLSHSISMIMTMFNTSLMQTIEPWLYRKIKERRIEDISKVAYPSFIIIAVANILLIAFSPETVTLFAPSEYHEAIYVIPPIAMSVYFMFSYSFFAVFEFYYSRTRQIAAATMAGGIMNIILNYIFINIFGYYAAGYTTLLCYILYALFHYISMKKTCREELNGMQPYSTKLYLIITIAFLGIGFLFLFSYKYTILRYGLIAFIVLFSVVEKNKIIKSLQNIVSLRRQ